MFGNALMRLFVFKGIVLPPSSSEPIQLKRIGKEVFHHMSIYVKDCLWYANDGAHYLHQRHRKRTVPFGTSSLTVQEGGSEPSSEPRTELGTDSRSVKQPHVSKAGPSGTKAAPSNVDLEQIKSVLREEMKGELSDMIKTAMKDEFSVLQKSNLNRLEAMELQVKQTSVTVSEIKKNSEKMLTELHHYRILYDEFSARVKKDFNNNVIGFDNFVSQVKKIGDSITNAFKTMDTKTDKTSQAVTNLHQEIKLFLSKNFPDYVHSSAHIIDLDASPEKPSSTKPSSTTSTSRVTRSRKS